MRENELPGKCINCGEPRTESRPFKSKEYEGTEYYCANCPREKWSAVIMQPVSNRAKKSWNGIMKAAREGRIG